VGKRKRSAESRRRGGFAQELGSVVGHVPAEVGEDLTPGGLLVGGSLGHPFCLRQTENAFQPVFFVSRAVPSPSQSRSPLLGQSDRLTSMAFKLHIPPCISNPAHPLHPPPLEKPLRIQIEGPVVAIQRLLPEISWHTNPLSLEFPQPAGPEIAKLAYRILYGRDVRPELANDIVVRDEYLGWETDVIPYR
jgi:hypothetical protein